MPVVIRFARHIVCAILLLPLLVQGIPASATHCGSGEFSVSGTFSDQATGQPLSVVADVTFHGLDGTGGAKSTVATKTSLPSSRYAVCLPTSGVLEYGVVFSAPGYIRTGYDFDGSIAPIPAVGAHVELNESQALSRDVFQSEMFFYRSDGLFRAYDPDMSGLLPRPVTSGLDWPQSGAWHFTYFPSAFAFTSGISHLMFAYGPAGSMVVQADPVTYSLSSFDPSMSSFVGSNPGWDLVTGLELNTVLFYSHDGGYQVREVSEQMGGGWTSIVTLSGDGWTSGWTSIVPVDLNGDNHDELLFYRKTDGLFRYYNVRSNGTISSPILAGSGYTTGWDSISAVDLDGDRQDELFFYRSDGLYRFYNIRPDASLPRPLLAGRDYTRGWDSITRFESCRLRGQWVCPPVG